MFGLTGIPHKAIAPVVLLSCVFMAGWTTRGWKTDSDNLATLQEQVAKMGESAKVVAASANDLEIDLGRIRNNERKLQNEILKLINNPVYGVVCVDAGGLRVIDSARTGTPTSEHDGGTPGAAPTP